MGQAVATFPLSFVMPNCSALLSLDQQVLLTIWRHLASGHLTVNCAYNTSGLLPS